MITVNFDTQIFTAVENQDNGNVEVYLKPEFRKQLGLQYPHIAVEVVQGNPLDSNIVIDEDCLEKV
tara:strand:- start:509 stop:706 length:198 start_codon:yes stop_codon:yes gene_type:complete